MATAWLFPLLDRITAAAYPAGQAWSAIHTELDGYADAFAHREARFARQAVRHGGVALTPFGATTSCCGANLPANATTWSLAAGRAVLAAAGK